MKPPMASRISGQNPPRAWPRAGRLAKGGGAVEGRRGGVAAAGRMGGGIAEVCARAGLEVAVVEVNEELAAAGRRRVENSLNKAVDRGKLAGGDRAAAPGRGGVGAE